jgi:DNA-directed RNA polymerase subunit RPC12/RpoP
LTSAVVKTEARSVDLPFPKRIKCHRCGAECLVVTREVYEMPEGMAGVAWARCRRCSHDFVRFLGEAKAAARLAEKWLGIQRR